MERIITTGNDYRPDPGSVGLGVSCHLRRLQAVRKVRDLLMIYHGDCLEIMPTLADKSIDLTVTSPPYDNLRTYNGNSQFDFEGIAKELFRVTKDGGVVVWVVGDATIKGSETGTSFKQALYFKEIGFNLHDTMIYEKSAFANPSSNRYHQIFEYMFIVSKGAPKVFHPIKDKPNKTEYDFGKSRRNKNGDMVNIQKERIPVAAFGMRWNIWRYVTGHGNSTQDIMAFKHPAIFPEKLATDHILSWSNEGDTVLDPFTGSGTTCKAAKELGRNFLGFEINPEYCKIAERRIAQEVLDFAS